MKDNKKKVLLFFAIIVIAIIITVLAIVLSNKEAIGLPFGGNNTIVSSLEAGSQEEIDSIIKSDLEKNKYSLNNAKIYADPYGTSPLSALMCFYTDKSTSVTVTIKGKNNDDITYNYESSTYHYIPIFALYQNYDNKVEIKLSDGTTKEFSIPTGELEFAPNSNVFTSETSGSSLYFITSPLNMRSFAIDAHGEVRWYSGALFYHDIVPLDNGHMLIGNANITNDGLSKEILEIDYLGRVYKTYEIDEGYLNDFFVKEDGNIIVASKKSGRDTFSDYIIEIDGDTGKIVKSWDVYEMLEDIDPVFINAINKSDYFYNSGIEYDESSDSLLLTYWGGEFVINLSYKDSSIKWIFSNPENLSSAFSKYLLKTESGFAYPKGMHSASLSGSTLKVFDNGYSTIKGDTNTANLKDSYSSANTYTISNGTISLVSSYDEDKQLFSYALGDYKVVSDKDEIILFGRELKGLDYSTGININDYEDVTSRLIETSNGKKVLDIELGWSTYSVSKVTLGGTYSYTFASHNYYTTLNPTKKEDLTSEIVKMIKECNNTIDYQFGFSHNMIELNVLFMSSDEAKLILIDDDNEGAVYTLKVKGETESKKIVTDLSSGKYYVYVLENGIMYKTDSYIEIK